MRSAGVCKPVLFEHGRIWGRVRGGGRVPVGRVLDWAGDSGAAVQLVKPDGWMKMMEALELVDDDFTLQNAMLCYVWSRMATVDEVRDYSKFESLTFVDFLEALGLIADSKMLPMASDMAEAGINSLQWALSKSSGLRLFLL